MADRRFVAPLRHSSLRERLTEMDPVYRNCAWPNCVSNVLLSVTSYRTVVNQVRSTRACAVRNRIEVGLNLTKAHRYGRITGEPGTHVPLSVQHQRVAHVSPYERSYLRRATCAYGLYRSDAQSKSVTSDEPINTAQGALCVALS